MEWLHKILNHNETLYVAIAASGGMARYLHLYLDEGKFAWQHFVAHIFVSSFSGYMFYQFAVNIMGFPNGSVAVFSGLGGWMGVEAMKGIEALIKNKFKLTDKDVK